MCFNSLWRTEVSHSSCLCQEVTNVHTTSERLWRAAAGFPDNITGKIDCAQLFRVWRSHSVHSPGPLPTVFISDSTACRRFCFLFPTQVQPARLRKYVQALKLVSLKELQMLFFHSCSLPPAAPGSSACVAASCSSLSSEVGATYLCS